MNWILKYLKLRLVLPTGPVPFGYKMGWFAIRSDRTDDVAATLRLLGLRPATWDEGISSGTEGSNVFVTPPVNGWICVVGERCMGNGDHGSVELVGTAVAETDLAMFDLSPEKEFRNEEDVISLASRWSFDPTQLSPQSAPAALGVIGELDLSKLGRV